MSYTDTVESQLQAALASVLIRAHADSGCSGSLTPHREALINVRPCGERFKAADGLEYNATHIGDMPVVASDSRGRRVRLKLRNVRLVPDFKYTLLSVRQLWNEQRIDARFADVNALVIATDDGEIRIPFMQSCNLPCVSLISHTSSSRETPASSANTATTLPQPSALSAAVSKQPLAPSSRSLGFHRVGATAHVARLPAAQAAELIHRRCLLGVDKLRATPHTTSDAPRVLASASAVPPNAAVAAARIRKAPHSTTLSAPAPEPGVLHFDLKELVLSVGGYRYVVFAIDEHSRFVFVDFIKVKSDVLNSVKRMVAAFDATVGVPVDEAGRALPRPRVRHVHSDREGKLMSKMFLDFRAEAGLHHTTSPPHDHDLNPIAERVIGLISEHASAIRANSGAPPGYWPWLITYAVDWHNATVGSVGSSTADASITPHQRFTLRPPRVMDLATFGCRAVVLKPPTHQHKTSLSPRGYVGTFLGRSRYSKGSYDVLVGKTIITSSSLVVDEEHFAWAPGGQQHRPLTALSHAAAQPQHQPLSSEQDSAGSSASAPSTYERKLRFLDLFSGPYARTDGLAAALHSSGWKDIEQIDNDGETGGGWAHDALNDEKYAKLMAKATAGAWDAMHIGFPCSTGALSRLFDASASGSSDSGPPMVRDADRPNGKPESEIDPRYHRELRLANLLLERVVALAIAARLSPARTRVSFEQPADRSDKSSIAYAPDLAHHGSILATDSVKRLVSVLGMKKCTFAYCRLGSPYQKYTTILYTPELGEGLDTLNEPSFQCNHERGTHAAQSYSPFDPSSLAAASEVMESAVRQTVLLAASEGHSSTSDDIIPISGWVRSKGPPPSSAAVPVLIAMSPEEELTPKRVTALQLALRADSPGAPSTHAEAVKAGKVWIAAESNEMSNHKGNASWTTLSLSEVPAGRKIHKLIWVYKLKRDGTAKARLCVQGNTLESGVDYDQVFSAALRYSSARSLFAYAARTGCSVRSVDLVAAYLQGKFVDGEVVFTRLPPGYPEFDPDGTPRVARIDKPIYGIQQAGRRLQRMLFAWLREQGFKPLDSSDSCVFTREHAGGEIITIGVYVDNLQIVHSARLDAKGRGPSGCAYNAFMDKLAADWDVTDEGPMEDLLGIEVDYLPNGSIKLHQTSYIRKLVERFCPDGHRTDASTKLPYSPAFLQHVADALSLPAGSHPELLKPMQERLGCLMYAATSTRCDIAFAVQYLCRCMQRPTPELIAETDHVIAYLARHPSAGLTYTPRASSLSGHADASWEVGASTSGWVVTWQGALLNWGSRKQKSIALSTCEAEIIALSEGAKDMVYFRKLISGLGCEEPGPSPLSTDSQSARDVSYNPQHHDRMKHVQRRHFFIRDMVESFELEVPYVRTADNVADMFTKPMKNANDFHRLRRIAMNETP